MIFRATTVLSFAAAWLCCVGAAPAEETTSPPATIGPADPFAEAVPQRPASPPAKLVRYAQRVIARHDADGDGRLQDGEWTSMAGKPETIDANQDGELTVEEFAAHVAEYGRYRRMLLLSPQMPNNPVEGGQQPNQEYDPATTANELETLRRGKKFYVPNSRLPNGLSQDFFKLDLDGDGQLSLSEFAPKSTAAELERFKNLDANLDGVVTAQEFASGPRPAPAAAETPTVPAAQP